MVFGNTARFAIEATFEPTLLGRSTIPYLGYMVLWIDGKAVGDPDICFSLALAESHLSTLSAYDGHGADPILQGQPASAVAEIVFTSLYGDEKGGDLNNARTASERFSRFVVCPGLSEAFDGDLVLLLEEYDHDRLIYRAFGESDIREAQLGRGVFREVARAFTTWLAVSAASK